MRQKALLWVAEKCPSCKITLTHHFEFVCSSLGYHASYN